MFTGKINIKPSLSMTVLIKNIKGAARQCYGDGDVIWCEQNLISGNARTCNIPTRKCLPFNLYWWFGKIADSKCKELFVNWPTNSKRRPSGFHIAVCKVMFWNEGKIIRFNCFSGRKFLLIHITNILGISTTSKSLNLFTLWTCGL